MITDDGIGSDVSAAGRPPKRFLPLPQHSSKTVALLLLLRCIIAAQPGAKIVVFSHWTAVLDAVQRALSDNYDRTDEARLAFGVSELATAEGGAAGAAKSAAAGGRGRPRLGDRGWVSARAAGAGRNVFRIDGSMGTVEVAAELAAFKQWSREPPATNAAAAAACTDGAVLLVSIAMAGVGLNLVEANHAVLLEPSWNPAAEKQAVDRVNRVGQGRAVTVYRLRVRGPADDGVARVQEGKRAGAVALLSGASDGRASQSPTLSQ
jgi:SNF2 family DNA or RNA helicase